MAALRIFAGRVYVPGYLRISNEAVDRLRVLGIVLLDGRTGWDGFYLTVEQFEEFDYVSGNPSAYGQLRLKA